MKRLGLVLTSSALILGALAPAARADFGLSDIFTTYANSDASPAKAAGVHPYNVTPEHTAQARAVLGPDALVLPEQGVVLTTDPEVGRWVGRTYLQGYLTLPNYVNNMRRMGFGDDDFAASGSDRLVDALVVWGDEQTIKARLDEHRAAGADHICIQVLSVEQPFPVMRGGQPFRLDGMRRLAPALTA